MPSRLHLLAAGVVFCLAQGPAWSQVETREGIALQNQIAELRQEIQLLQQAQQGAGPQGYAPPPQAYQPPGAGGDTTAQLVVRVSTLEEQNRQLQGRVDDLSNQVQRQHDELTKQIGDLSFKLGQGGAAPSAGGEQGEEQPAPARSATPDKPAPQKPAPPRRTPELALREGNAALARRDYAGAAAAAHEALGSGHGATAASAQFLLARAEGGQRQYKQAAADFYQAYAHNPRAPSAPVALLGVANALIAMGDNHDACQAVAKLQAEFPSASSVKAGAASARKRAACGR